VSPKLAQREIVLAGVALLTLLVSLAVSSPGSGAKRAAAPRPVASDSSSWYHALAAPGRGPYGRRSACGVIVRETTLGVAHPVLPCGAKIFIAFNGREVLTQIIDHAPHAPGQEFEVSAALAKRLGLHGIQPIRWSFARHG
jgi:rare lipoprotein A (peptidoglycan hydrolase)